MSYKDWYTINSIPNTVDLMCVAVDKDREFVKQYKIYKSGDGFATCECFAGIKFCRHKQIAVKFQETHRVDKRWYYNFDRDKWMAPINQEE